MNRMLVGIVEIWFMGSKFVELSKEVVCICVILVYFAYCSERTQHRRTHIYVALNTNTSFLTTSSCMHCDTKVVLKQLGIKSCPINNSCCTESSSSRENLDTDPEQCFVCQQMLATEIESTAVTKTIE